MTKVFLISKPGKPPNEMPSYGSISLLPITTKNYQKRQKTIIGNKHLISSHQFDFSKKKRQYIKKVEMITDIIEKVYEEKCYTLSYISSMDRKVEINLTTILFLDKTNRTK